MQGNHQGAGVAALVIIAALAVLAWFPQGNPSDDARTQAGAAQPVTFVMPEEFTPPELADEGAALVVSTCSACHSLEYITTQPRGMGTKFWHDEVTKMVKVYGAPIDQQDADAIADLLAGRFG